MKKLIIAAGMVMFIASCSSTSCTCPGNNGGECKCVPGSCECGPCKK